MSETIVRRRVVGFVKTKARGKSAGPRKQANVAPERDRGMADPIRAPATPARRGQAPRSVRRAWVWLTAAVVIALAVGGVLVVMSVATPPKDRAVASPPRPAPVASGARRSEPGHGAYPGSGNDTAGVPRGGSVVGTEEGFLAAGYVRRKPRLTAEGTATATKGGGNGGVPAAEERRSVECIVGAGNDIGACLRQLGAPGG